MKNIVLFTCLILLCYESQAQHGSATIQGKIIDEKGESLTGINVLSADSAPVLAIVAWLTDYEAIQISGPALYSSILNGLKSLKVLLQRCLPIPILGVQSTW